MPRNRRRGRWCRGRRHACIAHRVLHERVRSNNEKRLSPRATGGRRSRFSWARGCRASSSSRPTPGCSIRWAIREVADGSVQLASFWALVLNPWAWWQYVHNMSGAVITGAFAMASMGAFYLLWRQVRSTAGCSCGWGGGRRCIVSVLQLFPTGDGQGLVAQNQPVTLAAMEGLFRPSRAPSRPHRPAQRRPAQDRQSLCVPNAAQLPHLSRWEAEVKGLDAFPANSGRTISRCSITATTSWWGSGRSSSRSLSSRRSCCGGGKLYARWMLWILLLACRSPTSPTPRDGSPPRSAGSPGWSTG